MSSLVKAPLNRFPFFKVVMINFGYTARNFIDCLKAIHSKPRFFWWFDLRSLKSNRNHPTIGVHLEIKNSIALFQIGKQFE